MGGLYLGNGTPLEGNEGESRGFPPSTVVNIIQVAFAVWALSLIGFFTSIDKNYLHTFLDLTSSKQQAVREFRNATSDFERMQVFGYHKSYYASIRKEIKEWMKENYEVLQT